jgi:hypothetical protein
MVKRYNCVAKLEESAIGTMVSGYDYELLLLKAEKLKAVLEFVRDNMEASGEGTDEAFDVVITAIKEYENALC